MIWEQIQTTKREKTDLHIIWLDLANAYGSVPHLLVACALEFFYIPDNIRTMIMNYYQEMHVFCTEESHHLLETTGSRDRNGMLHFSHPPCGSV